MKNYVRDFLSEYNYPDIAADKLLSTYDAITNNPEAKNLWDEIISMYDANHNCDYEKIFVLAAKISDTVNIHEYTVELLVFICLSKHLREMYAQFNLPIEYYKNSMYDLRYKLDECQLVFGIVGSFVAPWFCGFFNLTRFGMGRLQFELTPFGSNYEKNGITLTPETKVINMHIPRSGEPLTQEACKEAYLMAKNFWKDHVPQENCPFVCHSWLLDPHFEEFLPKHTNTYAFFKSFDIYHSTLDKNRSSLWRLFDTMEQDPDKLPADTSMRRAFIAYLKNGGRLCEGSGVLFI